MSNTQKPKGENYSVAKYRAEAKGEPFVLELDNDESLTIPRPSGEQMMDAEEAIALGSSRAILEAICGEKTDALLEAVGSEDYKVLRAVSNDIAKHFSLGE